MLTPNAIRLAQAEDAEQIRSIYAPVVEQRATSFEWQPPDAAEMRQRVQKTLVAELPWLVYEREGNVLGYAYASRHRERAAYQWSVEASVYIHQDAHRSGLGRGLYTALFAILTLQGYRNVYAGVALPNPASVGLHESLGFRPIGVYHDAGYKFGQWHDVGWWELSLGRRKEPPEPTLTLAQAQSRSEWAAALAAGSGLVRL